MNFGISTLGPFQALILHHEDLRGGEVITSSTRMPNFSSGVKSLQFGLQSLGDCQAAGHLARQGRCLLPTLPWLCQGRAALGSHREQGWGVSIGVLLMACPFPGVLQQGWKLPGMMRHQFSPRWQQGTLASRCRVWDWGHVKEARFDEVTATEPSRDCCRGTTGISHSSPRSPSPSFPRRQNNPFAFWNKNIN